MSLPEPSFITRDPGGVTTELIALYEQMTGKTLQPAQPEMLLINLIAYRESLLRISIQEAAKQNLVEYANYPMLDYLGQLVGVARLEARPSVTRIRFTLAAVSGVDTIIPAGTVVATKDGLVDFATDVAVVIPAGQTTAEVYATATTVGRLGNGYLAGEINSMPSPVAGMTAVNIIFSSGGADAEEDDRLRVRIKDAPESFSNAGSRGAYRYWAMTAHQDIVDVAVLSPLPGQVVVYPLTDTGAPSTEVQSAVLATCSADNVRPLTDQVTVALPDESEFSIAVTITPYNWPDAAAVEEQATAALTAYAAELRAALGRDVIISQIAGRIQALYGVYKVAVTSPENDIIRATNQWGNCTAITITINEAVSG